MKYYIIAGEASGDLHGSNLMKGLYSEDPQATIRFWGGDMMNEVYKSCERFHCASGSENETSRMRGGLVRHYKDGAIMGFWEVFKKAGQLLGNVGECKADILEWNPDVVILIDYPGFNFRIAEFAHRHGIKVFYYIAPKVWASREGRIKKLKKFVDKLFIVFPFEIPYFEKKGVDFIYQGNPLVDAIDESVASRETRLQFLRKNSLHDRPIIAMLAGSRKGEISTMMPVLTEFAGKLHKLPQYKDYQFIVAGAPARNMSDYSPALEKFRQEYGADAPEIKVIFGQTQSVIKNAEAAVVNSGTASLETVLLGTPQVVGFIMGSRITYAIGKKIVKVKYISLGNLIIDRLAFKEFIQDDCNPDSLVKEVRSLIEDKDYRAKMLADYDEIRKALGGKGASAAVAKAMINEMKSFIKS